MLRESFNAILLSVLLYWLGAGMTSSAGAAPSACVVFACDGTVQEQSFLSGQSNTWVVNYSRVLDRDSGCVIYRLPVGSGQLERLRLEANGVPFHLEFSGDGSHWEPLQVSGGGAASEQDFATCEVDFTAVQGETARTSGTAWFRLQPAGNPAPGFLQIEFLRLDVAGASLPPQFVPSNSRGQIALDAAGPLEILIGIGSVLFVWRWWRTSWWIWAAGVALWVVSVGLKVAWAWFTLEAVKRWLQAGLPGALAGPASWGYVGILTGIFECGIFLVVARWLKRHAWTWHDALALGTGFGAVEALATGVFTCLAATRTASWMQPGASFGALASSFERVLALVVHVASAALILHSLNQGTWRWFAAAFIYKSAIDAVAAWLQSAGAGWMASPWTMEWLFMAPFGVLGVLILIYLRRRWKETAGQPGNSTALP